MLIYNNRIRTLKMLSVISQLLKHVLHGVNCQACTTKIINNLM